ncbi:16S rRNA (uracil(1498)-N(3))-methyltransferase [Flammeovirga kamogawensis]|uniref:Ribosomal RNA small subunit methyltransferase E n=1 Tax=Flammeovirga kamogawensis TaxID=373891 RepID=A0ABX8GXU6_9BACT|nr:16S rRNA (uracil(1498)-N(3))-methyltransferase [Flammeovirga kamogawensis]MBB6460667.1 16S rRNA (uracil1498-N3)-methyltransferase [Flammeovirga kamogawensis]QWG08022.1 16S rRNA (uracil(1498)-N(3))-methyltransferase [Flammeovirga kamogawensis]TRX69829.1 16S rRNA (uracil(1498)-N(3))-methyltransferase [Flammeovirga kamogawensis]
MRLFYHPNIDPNSQEVVLQAEDSKHIVRVLRMKQGDELQLMDGKGFRYTCNIKDANQKKCLVTINNVEELPQVAANVHIGIAPTKNMDRIEFFLEKAIEIGVASITFFYSTHSERKNLKLERLERIAVSAMKQSRKYWLPQLSLAKNLDEVFSSSIKNKYIAYVPTSATENLFQKLTANEDTLVLVGPEGGFSEEEAEKAKENGFNWVSLGTERLRTETAGIVAVQMMNMSYLK